jgi:hypothetical protein
MSFEIIFRVKAGKDLEEIEAYYNQISPGIAKNFFK